MTASIVKSRLDVVEDKSDCKGEVHTLLVFLPGAYDAPQDFVENGFVTSLRARNIAADVVSADAHLDYYTAGQLVQRLHDDVIKPARTKGYTSIWLIGISLGGYGSLLYTSQHDNEISGIFLMAPFLGNRSLLAQIAQQTLPLWQADAAIMYDEEVQLWLWLKQYCAQEKKASCDANGSSNDALPLYIGYGTEDRFTASNRMLAENLSDQHVMTTEGGHDWQAWHRLWEIFLDRDVLPRCV